MTVRQRGGGFSVDGSGGEGYSLRVYRSTDGAIYAAIIRAEAVSSALHFPYPFIIPPLRRCYRHPNAAM